MTTQPPARSFRVLGPVALVGTLNADDVAASAVYFNARYLLEAAADAPIPATKQLGNLTRTFVERAFDDMRWPAEYAELVRAVNRRLDEPDVWRLYLLRVTLQNVRLLRKYRGAFSTTSRGRELLAPGREGALYLELFGGYFERTNLAFTAYSAPSRSLIPLQGDHPFRAKPITGSAPNRSLVPPASRSLSAP